MKSYLQVTVFPSVANRRKASGTPGCPPKQSVRWVGALHTLLPVSGPQSRGLMNETAVSWAVAGMRSWDTSVASLCAGHSHRQGLSGKDKVGTALCGGHGCQQPAEMAASPRPYQALPHSPHKKGRSHEIFTKGCFPYASTKHRSVLRESPFSHPCFDQF